MKVEFLKPVDYCIGKLSIRSNYYFRRSKNGKVFVQRCPRNLSKKQKAWNREFVKRYAGYHPKPLLETEKPDKQ